MIDRQSPGRIWCAPYSRDRRELLPLFRLADDSDRQIQSYLYSGDILFASRSGKALGVAQIIGREPGLFELKSIAVLECRQGQGIGGMLMRAAIRHCRALGGTTLKVSTSIADSQAIAFYLRQGFRGVRIVRDAFTPELGYPGYAGDSGLPLNDAVELELQLDTLPGLRERTAPNERRLGDAFGL